MKFSNISLIAATALCGLLAAGCTEDSPITNPPVNHEPIVIERGTFARGADVSWVTELESQGYTFCNVDNEQKELMTLLRDDCGVNAIRLRVWVNPENDATVKGWCDVNDLVIKARRANSLGLRLMIDFHFSDTWADPGSQSIPAAWADMSLEEVKVAMTAHINDVLGRLKALDITPEWVQIGNETRTGMMWPLGGLSEGDNFTQMVNTGYDAVKAIFPDALVIVHCDSGDQIGLYTRLFGKLANEGGKYDMIGMSLYPAVDTWERNVADCIANVRSLSAQYGKPVMLCEIGLDYREAETAKNMMSRLMTDGVAAGLQGIFWWEPEAPASRGYSKGCFDDNGCPTVALDPFKQY